MRVKRAYNLGKRAASIEATRRRVLEAAAECYQALSIGATSMQEVARRADVAPGTVLHHFPDPNRLAEEVVAHLMASLELPSPSVFEGVDRRETRVDLLVHGVYGFYERSQPWVAMFLRERDKVPALAEGEATVKAAIADLVAMALGSDESDPEVRSVVGAAVDPGFLEALMRSGFSCAQATRVAAGMVRAWLAAHGNDARVQPMVPMGRHVPVRPAGPQTGLPTRKSPRRARRSRGGKRRSTRSRE